jgi:UDP-N-acetylmuramyl tripeptide synthase
MADSAGMSIQADEVAEVSRQLDELAGRAQRILQNEAVNLAVTPSARDEVSQRVAGTLNEVHASFGTTADKGLGEMREMAATLRGHSDNVVAADEGFIA